MRCLYKYLPWGRFGVLEFFRRGGVSCRVDLGEASCGSHLWRLPVIKTFCGMENQYILGERGVSRVATLSRLLSMETLCRMEHRCVLSRKEPMALSKSSQAFTQASAANPSLRCRRPGKLRAGSWGKKHPVQPPSTSLARPACFMAISFPFLAHTSLHLQHVQTLPSIIQLLSIRISANNKNARAGDANAATAKSSGRPYGCRAPFLSRGRVTRRRGCWWWSIRR